MLLVLVCPKVILANPSTVGIMRLVTHYWISRDDVNYVADSLRQILKNN